MKKYKLKLEVSNEKETRRVSVVEMGFTDKEWEEMTQEEQRRAFVYYTDNDVPRPYWTIAEIEEL